MRLRFIWCVFLFAGEIHFALSQTIDSESNRFSERAIQEMYQIYVDFSLRQMLLYNGIKYDEVARNPDVDFGHPFYLMDNVIEGSIRYNGVTYDNVLLQYDIVTDQIVTVLPNTNYKISLIKSHIQEFTLKGHRFVFVADGIAPGFYEVLLDGRIKVVAKRRKRISESYYNYNLFIKRKYFESGDLFVILDNIFFPVKSKKSLRNIFANSEQEFSSAIKNVSTSFKSERERYVIQLVEYFNGL